MGGRFFALGENMAEELGSEKKSYISKTEVARLFGLSGRRIEQLVEDGIIERVRVGRGVRFELASTVQKYVQYLSDKAYGRERSDTESGLKEQKLRAEVALKESQGELHRLRTEIAAGKYISVEEVKEDYRRFFIVFKNFALSMPSKMTGRLAGFVDPAEVREIESDLQKEVKKLLKDFVLRADEKKEEGDDDADEGGKMQKRRGRPKKSSGT